MFKTGTTKDTKKNCSSPQRRKVRKDSKKQNVHSILTLNESLLYLFKLFIFFIFFLCALCVFAVQSFLTVNMHLVSCIMYLAFLPPCLWSMCLILLQ